MNRSRCPTCGQRLPSLMDRPRTTGPRSQNKHLNGHVQQIAQETGEDFDEVKREIKRRARKRGYPWLVGEFGQEKAKSEALATVEECGMLIDEAHEVAAFLNIALIEYDDEGRTT